MVFSVKQKLKVTDNTIMRTREKRKDFILTKSPHILWPSQILQKATSRHSEELLCLLPHQLWLYTYGLLVVGEREASTFLLNLSLVSPGVLPLHPLVLDTPTLVLLVVGQHLQAYN